MRTVGIVAEYDPFHFGHAYQLAEARRQSNADAMIVVMSGFFTQRGEAALLSPYLRAEAALRHGADAVFLLPSLWSVRSSDDFAFGGIALLTALGVDGISFGAEHADASYLLAQAQKLQQADTQSAIRSLMQKGIGYPAAVNRVLWGEENTSLPNDTLALGYLRALWQLQADLPVYPVARIGHHHHPGGAPGYASGSAIRSAFLRGDWQTVSSCVPEPRPILDAAGQHLFVSPQALDQALLARLRTMVPDAYHTLPQVGEGLDQHLMHAAKSCTTRQELLDALSGKRYTRARISRLLTQVLLGIREEDQHQLPREALLLGCREGFRNQLGGISQKIPLLTTGKSMKACNAAWLNVEQRAVSLWSLAAGLPSDLLYTHGISIVP